ncbi:hypothetical protein [Pandoraea oxalativorans]|uniref:Uncharacterized protein n=1 Tax=Pandoraea oxalativorans TaxID=573737 RepID=A0A0G3II75_9BURK|nr:hypothetical protein MB84_28940 [Pandoraea oxalativorans]
MFGLSDPPEFIPVLSSDDTGVAPMHELVRELGTEDPEVRGAAFMARAPARNTHDLTHNLAHNLTSKRG